MVSSKQKHLEDNKEKKQLEEFFINQEKFYLLLINTHGERADS